MSIDNPLLDPDSKLAMILETSTYILIAVFTTESTLKIIAHGFMFCGPNSYLRDPKNVIDFIVVVISIFELTLVATSLRIFKVFKLFRVLKPLRVISRSRNLKLTIISLYKAIPNIFHVIMVAFLFSILLGIIGVNYFKGYLWNCSDYIMD